jgi:hypothetical protein
MHGSILSIPSTFSILWCTLQAGREQNRTMFSIRNVNLQAGVGGVYVFWVDWWMGG